MSESKPNDCICPDIKCKRHGDCGKCKEFHDKKGNLTKCKRSNIVNEYKVK